MLEFPAPPKMEVIPSLAALAPRVTDDPPERESTLTPLIFPKASLANNGPLTASVSFPVSPVTLFSAKLRPFRMNFVALLALPTR